MFFPGNFVQSSCVTSFGSSLQISHFLMHQKKRLANKKLTRPCWCIPEISKKKKRMWIRESDSSPGITNFCFSYPNVNYWLIVGLGCWNVLGLAASPPQKVSFTKRFTNKTWKNLVFFCFFQWSLNGTHFRGIKIDANVWWFSPTNRALFVGNSSWPLFFSGNSSVKLTKF